MDYALHHLGDLPTQSGEVLENAVLAYRTCGALNAAGDNCIVVPSYYTGTHRSYEPMIGPGKALDPERWLIVLPNAFGNGLSTSPSNYSGARYPAVSIADNVTAQHRLVFERLGVRRIALACGWSMGAMQSLAWAALYPDRVERLLAWCGAARCWPLNQVFLDGLAHILAADPTPGRTKGLKAFGRAYAGWAYSAAFFRNREYALLGYPDLERFLRAWEEDHLAWPADDLLAMLDTWRSAQPETLIPGADLAAYLGRIRARSVIMPCDQDAYFTVAESRIEAELIPGAVLRIISSSYGHCAGGPGRNPAVTAQIDRAIAELLTS